MRALRVASEHNVDLIDTSPPSLGAGEAIVRVRYSSLNYKDALALTGKGKIIRRFPLIAGVDLGGDVLEPGDSVFKVGDQVLATGCGLGEEIDGGYREIAHVPHRFLIPLPSGLTLKEALTLGTAGFTAALCLEKMELNGQCPEMGPIVVTGASGGVGMIAVNILAQRGYQVVAVSGKTAQHDFLRQLGAHEVCSSLSFASAPLASAKYGGAIDNLGGDYLSGLLKSTGNHGNVASVGLAVSPRLTASVFPHILRGVNLLGISSNTCPLSLRSKLWQRLATELKPPDLAKILTAEVELDQLLDYASRMLDRRIHGRVLVKVP